METVVTWRSCDVFMLEGGTVRPNLASQEVGTHNGAGGRRELPLEINNKPQYQQKIKNEKDKEKK